MCSVTCEKPTCADIVVCSDKLEASMITGLSRQTDRQREREREREREPLLYIFILLRKMKISIFGYYSEYC
jgi:hypothetical protein